MTRQIAMRTGFHSLIELLLRHEENQKTKNEVLWQGLQIRRPDLVELAVAYGALVDVVRTCAYTQTARNPKASSRLTLRSLSNQE